jgi:hypothetical protein
MTNVCKAQRGPQVLRAAQIPDFSSISLLGGQLMWLLQLIVMFLFRRAVKAHDVFAGGDIDCGCGDWPLWDSDRLSWF